MSIKFYEFFVFCDLTRFSKIFVKPHWSQNIYKNIRFGEVYF